MRCCHLYRESISAQNTRLARVRWWPRTRLGGAFLVYTVLYRGIAFVALVIYNSIIEGRRTLLATKPTLMGQFE